MKNALIIIAMALASAWTVLAAEDATMQEACKDTGLPPTVVGAIVAGALGGGYMYGRKHTVAVDPQPLEVRNADLHYVTKQEHDADMKRLYDLYYETSNKLSELIGLVQGIRDAMDRRM